MRIHSFTRILAMPFIIVLAVILYFLFFQDQEDWYPYLIPLVVILAVLYTYHPQIDYWWHKKHPPAIDQRLKKLVFQASPFYQGLDEASKRRFLERLGVFINHKAFFLMRKEKEKMPEDMKALIALNAITLTFGQKAYFFPKYDYYFAYQHPFPSPGKHFLHSVELNHPDGVMVFNADLLFQSLVLKNGTFNVGMYAFVEAYLVSYPLSDLAQAEEPEIDLLSQAGEPSLEKIILEIGFREISLKAVLVSLYFTQPEFIATNYPEISRICDRMISNSDTPLS